MESNKCAFMQWSVKAGKLVPCGKHADLSRDSAYLCHEHIAWAEDCAKLGRGKQVKNTGWLKKARTAYGIRNYTFTSGLPLGIPSDAGPMPKVWGTA